MKLVPQLRHPVPAAVQDVVLVLATDQLQAFVQPRWAVLCLQKLCLLGFQPGIGLLVDGTAAIVRKSQTDVWLVNRARA